MPNRDRLTRRTSGDTSYGQYYESEKASNYNYFRDYDPALGRYVESDLLGLMGGLNTYGYTEARALALVDPYGLANGPAVGSMRPQPPCICPYPPLPPPGVDVNKNMCEARNHSDPRWFYNQVRNKGPWDYKQRGSGYQDFGNFNYGATGNSFGFSDETLLRMAGWAQRQAGTSRPSWGKPWGSPPYGDDPEDQKWIQWGIQYSRCRCKP